MTSRRWEGPPLDAWQPWTPAEAALQLHGIDVPWCIVGGWALEVWLAGLTGEQTRDHQDLEIAIPRNHFAEVRDHFAPLKLYVVGDGEVRELESGVLPTAATHQNWLLDESANAWRVDIMLEPGDDQNWVFRRDRRIAARRVCMVGVRDGIPYLKPQGVLLYKAKAQRPKDEMDFNTCLPHLTFEDRRWLGTALQVVHPGHVWIERLTDTG